MKRIFGITGGLLLATLILATFLTHIHSSSTVNLKNTSLNHQQSNDNSKSSDKTNNSTTSNNTSSLTNQQAQLQQSEAQYQQDKALAQEYQNQANQDALNAQNSANVNSSTNWNSNTSTTNSSPQPQSWDCNSSLYTGFTGPYTINSISVDLNCNSSSGGTNELSCSGDISTMLTSQSYPYAQFNLNCTNKYVYSWDCNSSLYTGFTGPYTINSISVDLNCNSSSGGTNELSCSGDISTMLTSQSYPYAQLQMTCST